MAEDFEAARRGLDAALVLDAACDPARLNLACLLCPIPVVGDGRTKIAARKEPGGPFHGCGRRREYQRLRTSHTKRAGSFGRADLISIVLSADGRRGSPMNGELETV